MLSTWEAAVVSVYVAGWVVFTVMTYVALRQGEVEDVVFSPVNAAGVSSIMSLIWPVAYVVVVFGALVRGDR